jgi:hypothetical protein
MGLDWGALPAINLRLPEATTSALPLPIVTP